MAYYSKYTGAELEERLDKVEEIPQLIAQMITGKDFVTKEDLLCVLKDYAPADYRTIPIDNNTIYWENGVLKAATSEGGQGGQCQWELREHNGIQYLYSRLPVVTQYDVTMYADVNHLDLPSIYDGLPIDGDTIYWKETENGRILKSKYEGSSGVDASEVLSIVSSAGYATQNWVNNQNFINSSFLYTELAKYVKIKDYQEIEGVKNFLNGLQIAGLPITKLNGYEDVIYIDANVVVRGGVTMYYQDGEVDLPSIKDEIGNAGYDGATGLASFNSSQFSISSDGTVTIIGGSTGLDTAQLKDYLDSNKYTTETWVKEQGYASASSLSSLQTKVNNFLEGSDTDTIINKWKELEVFLSGLSESDNLADILSTKWTTDNNLINQWNTAYGWGDHSKVGYALKSYVDKTFVTIAGSEDVTGVHDFVNGLKIGNIKLSKSQEGVVYLEGSLVVKGGVTMYALDEITVDSIIDSLPLASTSQYGIAKFNPSNFVINKDGFVTIIGGSGGLDTEELADYLTTNKYATQSWVTNQKYITGITSAMVVSALGFTPYNSANFTKANIKSTLGISDWALASTKPSYNFSEIGTKPTTIAGYGITDAYTIQQADALYAKYLPLTGGTLTGELRIAKANGIASLYGYGANGGITMHFGYKEDEYLRIDVCNSTGGYVNQTLQIDKNNRVSINYLNVGSGLNGNRKAEYRLGVYGTFGVTGTSTFKAMTTHSAGLTSTIGNFSGEVSMQSANINGGKITYDATNKYWKLEGDLLVTGGVSMYSDDSAFTPSTIMDGVVVDGTSIRKNPTTGALEVIGGSGATVKYPLSWSGFNQGSYDGSVAQSFYIPTKLSEFVNDKSFATTSDLSGYLPLSGGTVRGILTIGGRLILGNGNAIQFTNADNKELLFYPYSQYNGDLGYYNGSSWGKVWTSANDGSGSGLDADTLDGLDATAFFCDKGKSNSFDDKLYNGAYRTTSFKPNDAYRFGLVASFRAMETCAQIYFPDVNGEPQFRMQWNAQTSITNDWTALITSLSIGNYNAGSATKLQTARTIWGQSFDGTNDVSGDIKLSHFKITGNSDVNILDSQGQWVILGSGVAAKGWTTYVDGGTIRFRYGTSSTVGMILNSSGNVLIGTITDSGYKLDVNGTANINGGFRTNYNNHIFKAGDSISHYNYGQGGGWVLYHNGGDDAARFEVLNSEGAWYGKGWSLTYNGNFQIGKTGTDLGYKLHVEGVAHTSKSFDIPLGTGDIGITADGKSIIRATESGLIISPHKSGTGGLYFRPNGSSAVTNNAILDTSGCFFVPSLNVNGIPIYKSQNDVLYIDGNLVVRGGVTMYAENEVDIPTLMDSIAVDSSMYNSGGVIGVNRATTSSVGVASFNPSNFTVDANGMVSLTSAPSSGASYLGKLDNVDDSIDATASVDRILYQPQGSSVWTWRELPKDDVVGNYLPLSGGTVIGNIRLQAPGGNNPYTALELAGSNTDIWQISGRFNKNSATENNKLNIYYYNGSTWGSIMTLQTNGYVGIGTESPGYNLHVNGSFGSTNAQIGAIFFGNTNEINSTGGRALCLNYEGTGFMLIGNNGYPTVVGTYDSQADNIKNTLKNAPFSVLGTIFGYRYGKKASGAAFMFDKPGTNYTGIGADGTTDTIYFGACNKDGDWVSYNQIWKFGGSIECGLIECGALKIWDTNVIDAVSGSGVHLNYYGSSDVTFCKGGGTTIAFGNLLTHGGITMYSDQRKKTILNHVELSLKQIADAPLIEHYYNSDQEKTTHVGSIAQYWASMNDWFCKLDNEGFYTMEIQNCALASAISIARHLEKYESKTDKKIRQLKKRISQLEDELDLLKKGV